MKLKALLAAAALTTILPVAAFADTADQTWTGPNSGGAAWNTTVTNWDSGVAWVAGNNAIFTGTGEAITVSGVTARNLTFNATGFSFVGAPALTGDAVITIANAAHTAAFDAFFGGSPTSITKSGAGTLRFTSDITVGAASLTLAAGAIDAANRAVVLGATGVTGDQNFGVTAPPAASQATAFTGGAFTAQTLVVGGQGGTPVVGIAGVGGVGAATSLVISGGSHTVTNLTLGGTGGTGGNAPDAETVGGQGGAGGQGILSLSGGMLTVTHLALGGLPGLPGVPGGLASPPALGGAGGTSLLYVGNDATLAITPGGDAIIGFGSHLVFGMTYDPNTESGTATTLTNTPLAGLASLQNFGVLSFSHSAGTVDFGAIVEGTGILSVNTGGTLRLTGEIRQSGTTFVSAGTLALADGGSLASDVYLGAGTLAFAGANARDFANLITGTGALDLTGTGTVTLSGDNTSFNGATSINNAAARLIVGHDNALGDATQPAFLGAVAVNAGTLDLNGHTLGNALTVTGSLVNDSTATSVTLVSGQVAVDAGAKLGGAGDLTVTDLANPSTTGTLTKIGAGTLTLAGATGASALTVQSGSLTFASGATLTASSAPAVTVAGGIFDPGANDLTVGALAVTGGALALTSGRTLTTSDFTLGSGATLAVTLGAPSATALAQVNGNLTLDGTLNVAESAPGAAGFGLYRLFNYTGALTDNVVAIGAVPSGAAANQFSVQTAVAGQVNLVRESVDTLFWDGAGPAGDALIQGGSGTWSATATNWTNAAGTAAGAQTPNPGAVIFAGSGGTVTVDTGAGVVGVTAAQFASDGYAVRGGDVTLSGTAVVRVGDGSGAGAAMAATIASRLVGSGSLEKTDLGTLVLAGANTYAGGTTVSAGTLKITDSGSVEGGIVNNAALVIDNVSAKTFANAVSGTGALTKTGTGALTVTGALTQAGGTAVSAGSLLLGDGGSLEGNVAVESGATFGLTGTESRTLTGAVSGAGAFTHGSTGVTTLSGVNTYTGGTTVSAGALQLDDAGALAGAVSVGATGAFGVINGSAKTLANDLSGGGYFFKSGAGNLTVTGAVSTAGTLIQQGTLTLAEGASLSGIVTNFGGSGTLAFANTTARTFDATLGGEVAVQQTGAGTTTLMGANAYTGGTAIVAGRLVAGHRTAFGTGVVALGFFTTVDLNGHTLANNFHSFGAVQNNATSAATLNGTLELRAFSSVGGSGDLTVAGVVSDESASGLFKTGTGKLTLSGDNTYTGATVVSAGTLAVGHVRALGTGAATVAGGATLDLAGRAVANAINVSGALVNSGAAITLGSGQVTLAGAAAALGGSGDLTVTDLAGAVALTKTGAGTLTLSGASAATAITVSGGALALGDGATFDTPVSLAAGTSLRLANGSTRTISAAITGEGALRQTVAGITTITGAATHTGGTFADAGLLLLGDTGSVTGSVTTAAGAGFGVDNTADKTLANAVSGPGLFYKTGSGNLTLTGAVNTALVAVLGGTLTLGEGAALSGAVSLGDVTLASSGAGDRTLAGMIAGSGVVSLLGTGATTLTGANTYSGGTRVFGGKLIAGSDTAFGTGNVALGLFSNAVVDLNGRTIANTFNSFGAVQNNAAAAATLTGDLVLGFGSSVGGSGDLTVAGIVSDVGASGLFKTGAGKLTLSGDNTYTGATVVSAGELVVGHARALGATPSAAVAVNAGAKLDLAGHALANAFTVSGTLQNNGAAAVTLASGKVTLAGTTASLGGSGSLAVTDLAGAAPLTKAGAGALTLAGATAATAITVNGGKLTFVSGSSLTAASAPTLTVNSGATFDPGANNLTVGATTVNDGGTLALAAGRTLTTGDLTLSAASTLAVTLGAPSTVGLAQVNGNLTLDGTLNIAETAPDAVAPGVYRLFNYTGALTDNRLALGNLPSGEQPEDFTIQTSFAGQVNLVRGADAKLLFWDGNSTTANGRIDGGAGKWTVSGTNWTTADGTRNGAQRPQPGFVVFSGNSAGTVTVDNTAGQVAVTGMQFTRNGYTLAGGAVDIRDAAIVRVDAGITATVNSVLSGTGSLTKSDAGTLVLGSANTYTGGTTITGGTLVLNAANTNTGGTTIGAGGTLKLAQDGGVTGAIANNGSLVIAHDNTRDRRSYQMTEVTKTFANAVSGSGSVTKQGSGTLLVTGALTHTGGTTVEAGTLKLNDSGSITGPITNNASMVVENTSGKSLAGLISGAGTFTKQGVGNLTFTAANTYTGTTRIEAGTLTLGAAQAARHYEIVGGKLALPTAAHLAEASSVSLLAGNLDLGGNSVTFGNFVQKNGTHNLAAGRTLSVASYQLRGDTTLTADRTLTVRGAMKLGSEGSVVYTRGSFSATKTPGDGGNFAQSGGTLTADSLQLGGDGAVGYSPYSGYGSRDGDVAHAGATSFRLTGGTATVAGLTQVGGATDYVGGGNTVFDIGTPAYGGAGTLLIQNATFTTGNMSMGRLYDYFGGIRTTVNIANGGTLVTTGPALAPSGSLFDHNTVAERESRIRIWFGGTMNLGWDGERATEAGRLDTQALTVHGTFAFRQSNPIFLFGAATVTEGGSTSIVQTKFGGTGTLLYDAPNSITLINIRNEMGGTLRVQSGQLNVAGNTSIGDLQSVEVKSGAKLGILQEETTGRLNVESGGSLILLAKLKLNHVPDYADRPDEVRTSRLALSSLSGTGSIELTKDHLLYLQTTTGTQTLNNNIATDPSAAGTTLPGQLYLDGAGVTRLTQAGRLTGLNVYVERGHTLELGADAAAKQDSGFNIRGTLRGSGTVRSVRVVDQGRLSVGNSPGILNVDGDFIADAGSTTIMEIAGSGPAGDVVTGFDQINAGGAVTLNGAVEVQLLGGYNPAGGGTQSFALFTSGTGQLTGTALANGLLPSTTFGTLTAQNGQITYTSYDRFADLPGLSGVNPQLVAAADALYAATGTTAPGTAAGNLLSVYRAGGAQALAVASPVPMASAVSLAFDESRATADTVRQRLAAHRVGAPATDGSLASLLMNPAGGASGALTGFAAASGATASTRADEFTYDRRRLGGKAGLESEQGGGLTLGGFAGYDRGYADIHAGGGRLDQDHLTLAAYLGQQFDNGSFATAGVFGGLSRYESKRQSAAGTTRGEADGYDFGLTGAVGHDFALAEGLTLTPFAGLTWTYATVASFKESGALPYAYDDIADHSLRSTLGADLTWATIAAKGTRVRLGFTVAWDHELTDNRVRVPASYFGQSVSASAPALARDYVSFGPSLSLGWAGDNAVRIAYLNEQGSAGEHAHRVDFTYSKRF